MPEQFQSSPPEALSTHNEAAPIEADAIIKDDAPVEVVPSELASARIRGPIPASPLERARLEAEGQIPLRTEEGDRSTMVALGLLFVAPILIILLSLLLLFPFINAQLTRDPDPGGAVTQSNSNVGPATR